MRYLPFKDSNIERARGSVSCRIGEIMMMSHCETTETASRCGQQVPDERVVVQIGR